MCAQASARSATAHRISVPASSAYQETKETRPGRAARRTPHTPAGMHAEGNVVASALVFAAAVALDALTALPTSVYADLPTSLRTTSLVLVCLIGAPAVDFDYLGEQRALVCLLLAVVAWLGWHRGDVHARIADAIYVLIGSWSATGFFELSGPKRGERGYSELGRRENVAALAAGFLLYAGVRATRAGMRHPIEVVAFTETHDDVEAHGVAMADDLVASGMVFGGLLCVFAACYVLYNHEAVHYHGCGSICGVIGVLSVLVFASAFVVQIALFAHMEELAILFGDASCHGDAAVCGAAFRARRFYASNGSPATLWACAVGLTLLAFPHDRRCRSRSEYYAARAAANGDVASADAVVDEYDADVYGHRRAATTSGWVAVLASAVALAVVWLFSDNASLLSSVEIVLLYVSIPVAWFGESWLACGLHAGGIGVYTAARLGSALGYDLSYLTHWCVGATLLITTVLGATTGITELLYNSRFSKRRWVEWVETLTALLLVALASVQLLLTLASLSLGAGYDGSKIGDARTWRQTSFEWATQHCVSFFFAAALVGGRFEIQNPAIARATLRSVWFGTPALLVALWTGALVLLDEAIPYTSAWEPVPIAIAVLGAAVPWATVGSVVC